MLQSGLKEDSRIMLVIIILMVQGLRVNQSLSWKDVSYKKIMLFYLSHTADVLCKRGVKMLVYSSLKKWSTH